MPSYFLSAYLKTNTDLLLNRQHFKPVRAGESRYQLLQDNFFFPFPYVWKFVLGYVPHDLVSSSPASRLHSGGEKHKGPAEIRVKRTKNLAQAGSRGRVGTISKT